MAAAAVSHPAGAAAAARVASSSSGVHLLQRAKEIVANVLLESVQSALSISVSDMHAEVISRMTRPPDPLLLGDLSVPIFVFSNRLPAPPAPAPAAAADTAAGADGKKKKEKRGPPDHSASIKKIADVLAAKHHEDIARMEVTGPYFNFFMSPKFIASVVPAILQGDFLAQRSATGKSRCMIEYSQPNTHKVYRSPLPFRSMLDSKRH
jgi:hypothetical protein